MEAVSREVASVPAATAPGLVVLVAVGVPPRGGNGDVVLLHVAEDLVGPLGVACLHAAPELGRHGVARRPERAERLAHLWVGGGLGGGRDVEALAGGFRGRWRPCAGAWAEGGGGGIGGGVG